MPSVRARVLMISTHGYVAAQPQLGRADTGGQVVYVLELAKHLARLGCEVDIATRRFEDQPACDEVAPRVRVVRFPCGPREFVPKETLHHFIPEWCHNADRELDAAGQRYDFINSHYWDAGLAGQRLAEQWGIRHLHTPHSLGAWKRDSMSGSPEELERSYNFRQRIRDERALYHACHLVLATTTQQRSILRSSDYDLPAERVRVIPPGYDDTRFFPVSAATRQAIKQDLDLSGQIVLALGRLATNKGYDLLMRSMLPVFARFPDAKLLLAIGAKHPTPEEKSQRAGLAALAAGLGITDRVVFRDYVPDEQLADYYRAADVFALCSRYEPFGMTAVEAMACGTPTVVTTEGGLWEQVAWGVEALYADPHDTEAYGHKICSILQYPEVSERLAQAGSVRARAHFTWSQIAQQVLQVMDEVPVVPTVAAVDEPDLNLRQTG